MNLSKISFLSIVFLFILAGCQSAVPAASDKPINGFIENESKPNIVFIFADDIGFGDVGANGNKVFETPNIDSLASSGTNFQQFTVASPVCSPSRAAVLTGQFPDQNAIFQHFHTTEHHETNGMPDWLDPSSPSMARMLQSAGYATGHFGKWHLTNSHISDAPEPSEYGFDDYAVFNGPGPQTDAVRVFDDALAFIDKHQDAPFFLNLWIHETHTPHYPDPDLVEMFSHLGERQQMYAATIASADAGVGQVMDRLSATGLLERTIVIFSSDNGPEVNGRADQRYLRTDPDAAVPGREPLGRYFSVGETGGLRGRKRDLFEGGVRVPFIVSWPGTIPAGRVDDTSVINAVDLLPTFASLAGTKIPNDIKFDGEDITDALLGEEYHRSKPVFWQRLEKIDANRNGRDALWSAIRDGDWKYMQSSHGEKMLFHLPTDRAEAKNLAEERPEIAAGLQAKLTEWRNSFDYAVPENAISSMRK